MASVRRRGATWSYRYSIVVSDEKGERKYKTVEKGGFKTKTEAQEAGQLAEQGQKHGYKTYNLRECSFGQILDEWEEDTRYLYKKTTQRSHRKEVKLIKEYLGDMNVQQISLNVLNTFIRQMIERGHTRHRLMSIKGTLSQAMKYAYISGYIIRNPAAELKLPTARASAEAGIRKGRSHKVISKEVIDAIFKRFPFETGTGPHPQFLPLYLAYNAGLRRGEAYAVTVDNVDLEAKTITVDKQIQVEDKTCEIYISAPKFDEVRVLDLTDQMCDVLKEFIERRERFEKCGLLKTRYYKRDNGVLDMRPVGPEVKFLNIYPDGKVVSPRGVLHVAQVIHGVSGQIDAIDPGWTFHSMRHTHASELASVPGMPPTYIQERLGHKHLTVTQNVYIHSTSESRFEGRQKLQAMQNESGI